MVLPHQNIKFKRQKLFNVSKSKDMSMDMEVDTTDRTPPLTPSSQSPDLPKTYLPDDCSNFSNGGVVGVMLDAMSIRIQDLEQALVNSQNRMGLLLWWITQKFGDDVHLAQIMNMMNNLETSQSQFQNQNYGLNLPDEPAQENPSHLVPEEQEDMKYEPSNYLKVHYRASERVDTANDSVSEIINQVSLGKFDYNPFAYESTHVLEQEYIPSFNVTDNGVSFFPDPSPIHTPSTTEPKPKTEPQPHFSGNRYYSPASKKTSPRVNICRLCDEKFDTESLLNQHKLSHLTVSLLKLPESISMGFGPINFNCETVESFQFNTRRQQMKTLKSPNVKIVKLDKGPHSHNFKCHACSRSFHSLKQLESHSENPKQCWSQNTQCTLCEKWLKNNATLRLHVNRKHTNQVSVDLSSSKV